MACRFVSICLLSGELRMECAMDHVKGTRQAAATSRVAQTPLTDQQLAAFEKSGGPAQHVMVKRIINALRSARRRIDEVSDELRREQQKQVDERVTEKRPAVLIVVACDGWVDVYADATVDLLGMELKPWDDETKLAERMSYGQREKFGHLPNGKVPLQLYPHYASRPNEISEEALSRIMRQLKQVEHIEKFNELIGLLSKRVRDEGSK
jgi:hypothetical protein